MTPVRTPMQMALRRFGKNRLAIGCAVALAAMMLGSWLVPVITGIAVDERDPRAALSAPRPGHLFGTDAIGRDLLTRVFLGLRITFVVGATAVAISLVLGVVYGAVSGYFGGWVDNLMMRVVDVLYGLPTIAFLMLILSVFKDYRDRIFTAGSGLWRAENKYLWDIFLITVSMGMLSWLTIARIVRGQVLTLKEMEYVEAARAIGSGHVRIIFRHIVPNLLGPVIVYATLTMPSVMLFESFLSFLGLGIQEPNVSLGLLLDDGIKRIAAANLNWWLIVFPGTLLAVVLFCLNIIGDGLRDAFDVRSSNA